MKFLSSAVQKLSSEKTHRQTDGQTDTQTDTQTDRLDWNYYLLHRRMVIKPLSSAYFMLTGHSALFPLTVLKFDLLFSWECHLFTRHQSTFKEHIGKRWLKEDLYWRPFSGGGSVAVHRFKFTESLRNV